MAYRRGIFFILALLGAGAIFYLLETPPSSLVAEAGAAPPQMMGSMENQGRMQEMMRDNVPPGVKPRDLPAPQSKGARLTVRYCAQCHNLPTPAAHSAREWEAVVHRMVAQMQTAPQRGMMEGNIRVPSAADQKEILSYLQAHALKPLSPGTRSEPNSPGAVAFSKSCSGCHALPNPKLYTAAGWPDVVRKMQSYASQMGGKRKVITNRQAKEIERYLASRARH